MKFLIFPSIVLFKICELSPQNNDVNLKLCIARPNWSSKYVVGAQTLELKSTINCKERNVITLLKLIGTLLYKLAIWYHIRYKHAWLST